MAGSQTNKNENENSNSACSIFIANLDTFLKKRNGKRLSKAFLFLILERKKMNNN